MKNHTHNGFQVRQEGYRQVVQLRASWLGRIGLFLFMTVWLSGWSVGCAMLIYGLVDDFSWFAVLYSIPFIVGWVGGAAIWLASLFGRTQLILEKDHLGYEFSVLVPVKRRSIPYKEILSLELISTHRSSVIEIRSTSKTISFGSGQRLQVLEELHEFLLGEIPIENRTGESDLNDATVCLQRREIKPESSRWHLEPRAGLSETRFVNRGTIEFGATLLLVGIALFWNGIVGVFVVQDVQAWRGLGDEPASVVKTIFLIPFIVIGIVMFLILLFTVLEPFRKTVYGFSSREIYRQFGYFGISWNKVWPVAIAVTMELGTEFEDDAEISDGTNYSLKFSQGEKKLVEIGALTLAEVCWIATEIEKTQSSYLWGLTSVNGREFVQESKL